MMERNASAVRRTYRVEEVADMLGVARATAYNLVKEGYIRSSRAGRLILVPVEALDEFLSTATVTKTG